MSILRLYADGGSRGNPGPSAYGAVIYRVHENGEEELLAELSEYLGSTTNNQAEYQGLVAALNKAHKLDPKAKIEVRMDSELVVKQMKGEYNVKNKELGVWFVKAKQLELAGVRINYEHVRREKNKAADALVNLALDRHSK